VPATKEASEENFLSGILFVGILFVTYKKSLGTGNVFRGEGRRGGVLIYTGIDAVVRLSILNQHLISAGAQKFASSNKII
jgi:hypothetical protein